MKVSELPTAVSAFQEMKSRAERYWRGLSGNVKPVIMVSAATCGRAAGALEVLQAIKDEVEEHKLDCHVVEVGCTGHCYADPMVIIRKPGYPAICYAPVNPVIAERLVKDFVLGDDPCLEFVFGALEENPLVPSLADFPRARYEERVILENCGRIDPTEIDHYIASGGYSAGNPAYPEPSAAGQYD